MSWSETLSSVIDSIMMLKLSLSDAQVSSGKLPSLFSERAPRGKLSNEETQIVEEMLWQCLGVLLLRLLAEQQAIEWRNET